MHQSWWNTIIQIFGVNNQKYLKFIALPSWPLVRKPRLLFIVNDSAFFASHRLPIGHAAVIKGYDVHLAAADDDRLDEIRAAGIVFHPLPVDRTGLNPFKDIYLTLAICQIIRRLRPDIVHNVTVKPVLYGGLAARICHVPAVVSAISGLGYAFEGKGLIRYAIRWLVRIGYRIALAHPNSRVIFQNSGNRDTILSYALLNSDKTVLIRGSGVDVSCFVPVPEAGELPIVLFPARLIWAKGVGEFVKAARKIRAASIPARFVLVGEIPAHNRDAVPRDVLMKWITEGAIEWWGYRSDMPSVFAASHIVCLPSYHEGLPKVLLEAAAAGRPIVTTSVAGCCEVVIDGMNGFLVPPHDAERLAEALMKLLRMHPAVRHQMGLSGRDLVIREFSVQRVINDTLHLYGELLMSRYF